MTEETMQSTKPSRPVQLFISYAHRDSEMASALEKHLSVLARMGEVKSWFDRSIEPGADWRGEIDKHLNSSEIILLLVSADFLASDYCYDVEMRRALERHDTGKAVVIPVIARACDWSSAPFSKLQALPRDGKPVSSSQDIDSALAGITADLRSIIKTFHERESVARSQSVAEVELIIDRDFDSFTEEDKDRVLRAIKEVLHLGSDVKIVRKDRGSVKLRFRLSADEVSRLHEAVQNGELRDLDVVDAEILVEPQAVKSLGGRPSVFIGSSKEGLTVAEAIQVNLDEVCEATLWSQGVFGLGQGTLESLVQHLDEFDFAIMILTPDDLIESQGDVRDSPRDNVLLEMGLFIGRLGRERTFTVYDRTADLKLPSDIAGVTLAPFQPHSSGNFEAALGAPCTKLKKAIVSLGPRARPQHARGDGV